MDLQRLDSVAGSEEGKWIDILDPDGNHTGIEIKCKGIDSKAFKAQSTAIRKYVQKQKEKGQSEDTDVMDEKSHQMLASVTLDWRDISEEKTKESGLLVEGKVLPYNIENAKYVYESYPLIANQVASFVMERSNFLAV